MQILVTDVIDAALIVGVVAVFLFLDIMAKYRLKIGIKDIGADLAIAAFFVQLAFISKLLTGQQIEHLNSNIILILCFSFFWIICLWLPSRKDVLAHMLSYTLGIFALAVSMMHALSISGPTGMMVIITASFILSIIGFLFADNLKNERIKENFSEMTKDLSIYEMSESYRKLDTGRSNFDPLQPVIDITRGAVRRSDEFTAIQGIRCLRELASRTIATGGNISLIIKHLNSNLYDLSILAEEENNRDIMMETMDAFGVIGTSCARKGMESLTLQCAENIYDFFELHKDKTHFSSLDKFTIIRNAKDPDDFLGILKKNPVSTPRHKIAIACKEMGKAALEQDMMEPADKLIAILKLLAIDAVSKNDMRTLEFVRIAIMDIAIAMKDSRFEDLKKQIIISLRDSGVKTVQEYEEDKKSSSTERTISLLKEIGEIFGETSYQDVINSLHDIGIVAARKHEDKKLANIIPHMEFFCVLCTEKKLEEKGSLCVNAIADICELAIREKMEISIAASSKALARLSLMEKLSISVNDAVFELGKYKNIDREMFSVFEKNYNKAGGK